MKPVASLAVLASLAVAATARASDDADDAAAGFQPQVIDVHHPEAAVPLVGVPFVPPARILYLNDCKPDGCVIRPASRDDSRKDESSIVDSSRRLSPFAGTDDIWERTVACVRENYAPFTIQVVTEDPGDVPHFEAYVAGKPGDLLFPENYGGVASFSCGVIPNAVSFSFANLALGSPNRICSVVSQETAHNFGLQHEMLAEDAMTYIPLPTRKRFVDQVACIGTQGCCQPESECKCGLQQQSSHQRLVEIFGAVGATPPDVVFTEPINGQNRLLPGFPIRADIVDWDGVVAVELLVDDVAIASTLAPPYSFRAPADLAPGMHKLTLRAIDTLSLLGQSTITVSVIAPCSGDESCAGAGPGWVCGDDGRCHAPPPVPPDDGGCAAGGSSRPLAPALLLASLAFVRRRRRRVS